jgi:hypothetical protein
MDHVHIVIVLITMLKIVQYFAMLSLRIWLNFNFDLYFIGELNMMNT